MIYASQNQITLWVMMTSHLLCETLTRRLNNYFLIKEKKTSFSYHLHYYVLYRLIFIAFIVWCSQIYHLASCNKIKNLIWQELYVVDIQAKFLYSGLNCMCVRILTIFVIVNNVTTFEYKHVPNFKNPEILLILSLYHCIKFETYSCKIWRIYNTRIIRF